MVDFAVIPERTALLNVDLQNCFVENSPIAAPDGLVILERVNRLAAACRKAGILVIHASVVVRPDHSNLGTLADFNPLREGRHPRQGSSYQRRCTKISSLILATSFSTSPALVRFIAPIWS